VTDRAHRAVVTARELIAVIRPVTFLTRRGAFMSGRIDFTWNFYANSSDEFFHDPRSAPNT
jgi:hypothetical protein